MSVKVGIEGMEYSDTLLNQARQQGDDLVDPLAAELLESCTSASKLGRQGYNHLLDVADKLIESPELLLLEESNVRQDLENTSPGLRDYFDPISVPDWVEEERIARACRLWQENMISALAALYSTSLPQCYLIARGIPALYATGKLLEHDYLSQRIYETGLMLDAVLTTDGMKILRDLPRDAGTTTRGVRYLWGRGFIAARKVRLLHAAMRYMLLHPDKFRPTTESDAPQTLAEGFRRRDKVWPVERDGLPVNQEDLAYTLLTFGYSIPRSLESYGLPISARDREDFLHAWRLVGFIMGIRNELLPHDVTSAGTLFTAIRSRQAAGSEAGVQMTASLMEFLGEYLPHAPFLRSRLPAALILHQLGDDAKMILTKDDLRAARNPILRLGFSMALSVLRVYFLVREMVFRRSSSLRAVFGGSFHDAGVEMIHSWRSSWRRTPFSLSTDLQHWEQVDSVDPAYRRRQNRWRQRLFRTIFIAIGFFVITLLAAATFAVTLLFEGLGPLTRTLGWGSLASFLLSLILFKIQLPRVVKARPKVANR